MTQITVTIKVGQNDKNFTLTDGAAPGGMAQVTGMEMVGLSKSLATAAQNKGETFGIHVVGSPSDGIDAIAKAIKDEKIKVYR